MSTVILEFYSANVVTPNLSWQSKPPKSQKQKKLKKKAVFGVVSGNLTAPQRVVLATLLAHIRGITSPYYLAAFYKTRLLGPVGIYFFWGLAVFKIFHTVLSEIQKRLASVSTICVLGQLGIWFMYSNSFKTVKRCSCTDPIKS
ncbi:MAG: hypothetical protein WCR52_14375 [Bacteroidota bacterium]